VVLISGLSALPPFELIFVDAHVGRGSTLDDLIDTMRRLIRSRDSFAEDRPIASLQTNSASEHGLFR
jgi:hypothetical protein